MRKKGPILIISWSVFPHQSAMAVLVNNLAKTLGKEKVVVAGEISRDSSNWDSIDYPLYHLNPFPFKFVKGREYFKWINFGACLSRLNEICKKHNCSSILCPFPDEFYMNLARRLAKKRAIPFYPWFHNTYHENRTGLKLFLAKYLQPKFFKSAKKIFSISEGLTEYYKSTYPGYDFETLLHGFDIPETHFADFHIDDNQNIKFAYTGSFNESCREAAVRLAKLITSRPNFEFHVFGKRSVKMFENHGIPKSKIIGYGFLEEDLFLKKLKACHIMLLPHGFTGTRSEIEYKTIFPTRSIPLLYSNRPILLHSPKWASITRFFEANECGVVVSSNKEEAILESIEKLINDQNYRDRIIKNALTTAKKFDVKSIALSIIALNEN